MKANFLKLLVPPSRFWLTTAVILGLYDACVGDQTHFFILVLFGVFHFLAKLVETLETFTAALLAVLALKMGK